jgi:catechol 2,3-dioxygenase-like lactoylglutathione lyase family enzyme
MTPKFDLIGLVVEDLERSLDFYRRLGFDIPAGEDHVEAKLPGGLRFAWDTVETIRSFDPEWEPPSGGQQIGLAFLVDSPAEVDALYAELSQAGQGGHKEPWDAFWGQRYAQVKDPDGNVVDLFAPLESQD